MLIVLLMSMDKKEFETQAKRLRPQLVKQAYRVLGSETEADDIAQETLLKLWGMREQLDEYSSLDALSFVVTRHLCLDNLKRMRMLSLDEVDVSAITSDLNTEEPTQARIDELNALIKRLPDGQQIILRMKHIDGMETSEIAQMIGSTDGAVRVQLSRARNKVRELFLNKKL